MIQVTYQLISPYARLADRATSGSIAYDVYACLLEDGPEGESVGRHYQIYHRGSEDPTAERYSTATGLRLHPGERAKVPLGVKFHFQPDVFADIRAKFGRAWDQGLALVNGSGAGASDYAEEYTAIVMNHGSQPIVIHHGEKIAQVIFVRTEEVEFREGAI